MTEDPLWAHPSLAWLVGAARRLRRADRQRPWLLDSALVLAVLLFFGLLDLHGLWHAVVGNGGLPAYGVVAVQLGLVLPLWWRRRAPSAVFAVVLAVFLVQLPLSISLHSDIALFIVLFIALYSLARYGRPRHLGFACAAVLGSLLLAALRVTAPLLPLVALFFLSSAATAAVALGLGIRLAWANMTTLKDRAAQLALERDQRSRLATAAERARIAREMHDIVGHNLSVIVSLADGGAQATPERTRQALQLISGTSRQALNELRRTLTVLHEERHDDAGNGRDAAQAVPLSPQPGIADLDALCERVRAAGPQVVYRTAGQPQTLDPGIQLAAYRIVQEALTNTLKHAASNTRAHLAVSAEDGELHIRIDDTGPAADHPQPAHRPPTGQEGHGITGMRERAALYGGTVTARPRPGGGWRVDAVLHPSPAPASPLPPTAGTP